jgi:hypothetical protein
VVRTALVVPVASCALSIASGFGGFVPAVAAAAADGGRTWWRARQRGEWEPAGGSAALVRDALVVSPGRHRDHAPGDDTQHPDDAGRHDAPESAGDTAGFHAASAGHVFCLSTSMMDGLRDARLVGRASRAAVM